MRTFVGGATVLVCLLGGGGCDDNPTSPTSGSSTPGASSSTLTATRFLAFGDSLTEGEVTAPVAGRQRSVPDNVVRAFNDELRAIAAGEGAVVVDVYSALSSDVPRYIGVDGHHPTEAGYQRIAEEFLARISAELEPR